MNPLVKQKQRQAAEQQKLADEAMSRGDLTAFARHNWQAAQYDIDAGKLEADEQRQPIEG